MHQLVVATPDGEPKTRTDVEAISGLIPDQHNVVWFDLEASKLEDVAILREGFNFHPLALEDAVSAHQKPKIDSYAAYYFVVFYSIGYEGKAIPGVHARQIGLFIGPNYLVTVHSEPIPEIEETLARWQKSHETIGHTVGAVVYALLDAVVDHYFPVIDEITDHVEMIEEQIFENFRVEALETVFGLKKDLLTLRRIVAPSRDVMNMMLHRDVPIFDRETIVYIQDIYDHIVRVTDSIDVYRDLLSNVLDAYLSMTSNRMNQTVRVLTASSIILMSMALIAGIYGMNFRLLPELEWTHGYLFAICLMIAVATTLALFFRRRGWL
jgi:magnesium transporter